MSFALKLLGGVALEAEGRSLTGPAAQRHRLALMAILAMSRGRPVSRDKVLALLWPDRETEPARQILNQAIHALRRALGAEAILSAGDDLQLNGTLVSSDVTAFDEAIAASHFDQAVRLYGGPFLDGFFLDDAPEFEQWADRERDRLSTAHARALEGLAESAEQSGDSAGAVEWWKARAARDPYDSRVALRVMLALERAGNRAGALQHALAHQELLRTELDIQPDGEVLAAIEQLRREPAVATVRRPDTRPGPASAPSVARTAIPLPDTPRRQGILIGAAVMLGAGLLAGAIWLGRARSGTTVAATPAVVDEIAHAVARELARREGGDTGKILPQHRTRSIAAYELYVKGSDPTILRSDSAARLGLDYFKRAVALDSNYAAAWAGVARMTLRNSSNGPERKVARPVAQAAIERALAIDSSLAEGHAIFGLLRGMAYDFAAAEVHLKRAIALEPTSTRHRERLSRLYLATERPVEALVEAERALAIDPLSPAATAEVARALLFNDRCDEALARLEPIRALDPPLLRAAPIAALCYARKNQWGRAIAAIAPSALRGGPEGMGVYGYVLARSGDRDAALAVQDSIAKGWREGALGAYDLAIIPAGLGDRDEAFEWLGRAFDDGSLAPFTSNSLSLSEPMFNELHDDARWRELRRRVGLQNR